MTTYEAIIYDVDDRRATITLNRPERRNSITMEMERELHDALWRADGDPRVRVIVLRGAGPSFCSGYDIRALGGEYQALAAEGYRTHESVDDDAWHLERSQRQYLALFQVHKPVIARVHGHCLAGGAILALLADIVVAADDASIGFPPARAMGASPSQMWIYHVGPQWAKRLLLTGDTISGAKAAAIGLVLEAVPSEMLDDAVDALADRMAGVDPHLLSANKRQVNLALELMGAGTMQRLAAEIDARAHLAPSVLEFGRIVREEGLKAAVAWRDGDQRSLPEPTHT